MEDDVYAAPESAFESHRQPGDETTFTLARCLNDGGEAFRREPAPGILATIVMLVLIGAAYFAFLTTFGALVGAEDAGALIGFFILAIGGSLALYLFYRLLQAGMQILGMNLVRGGGRIEDIFSGFHRAGSVCGATFLIYFIQLIVPLIVFVILVVLIVSSDAISEQLDQLESDEVGFGILGSVMIVVWALKLYLDGRLLLTFPLILERKAGVVAAVVQSWRRTAPYQLQLAFLALLTEIAVLAGLVCCGIGALITVPLHYTIQGSAALQLLNDKTRDTLAGAGETPDRFEPPDAGGGPASSTPRPAQDSPAAPERDPYDSSPYS
ncbi:MAG: hypothetical protein RIF32_00810 [Leptospirales bacterium]|jgi:MFS family permease